MEDRRAGAIRYPGTPQAANADMLIDGKRTTAQQVGEPIVVPANAPTVPEEKVTPAPATDESETAEDDEEADKEND